MVSKAEKEQSPWSKDRGLFFVRPSAWAIEAIAVEQFASRMKGDHHRLECGVCVSVNNVACDVLIFFATSSEKKALRDVAKSLGIEFRKASHGKFQYIDMGRIGVTRVNAVQTEMGPFGFGGSASKGIHYKQAFHATEIIQIGMAFGVNEDQQKPGDVLISTALLPYDYREVTDTERGYQVNYSEVEPCFAKQSLLEQFRAHADYNSLERSYGVFFGGILSGGAKIRSKNFVDEIRETIPKVEDGGIIGGEMEGVGLLSISPKDESCWIIVKGISDFGNDERDRVIEQYRPIACRNSAMFVLSAILGARP